MVAEFKSHTLSRDEKGFAGVPFKRLMLAGVGGGIVYTLGKFVLPDWAIPLGAGVGMLLIVLSAPRGGIPRWQRLLYSVRGALMLASIQQPESLRGRLARFLELPTDLVRLEGKTLFAPPSAPQGDWTEWVTFARVADADREDGLSFREGG